MRRVLPILFGACVVVLAGGFLALGAFPPKSSQHVVHHAVPIDKLTPQAT